MDNNQVVDDNSESQRQNEQFSTISFVLRRLIIIFLFVVGIVVGSVVTTVGG